MPNPSAARPTGGAGRPSDRTADRLAGVDPQLLASAGLDAQATRRELLRGSTMVIVGVGYPTKRFIYERAAELGVRQVLIDQPGHWGEDLVTEGSRRRSFPRTCTCRSPNRWRRSWTCLGPSPRPLTPSARSGRTRRR